MIWVTSDWHCGHENILKYQNNRGVSSMEEMNDLLITNYNNAVSSNDIVYFLGDIIMGDKVINIPSIMNQIPKGKKIMCLGNHDGGFHNKADSDAYIRKVKFYILNGFETVSRVVDIAPGIKGSHFPWRGVPDRENGREYLQKYAPADDGVSVLLHGHSHQPEKVSGVRMIHVGVDAHNMCPVSMDEIHQIIKDQNW